MLNNNKLNESNSPTKWLEKKLEECNEGDCKTLVGLDEDCYVEELHKEYIVFELGLQGLDPIQTLEDYRKKANLSHLPMRIENPYYSRFQMTFKHSVYIDSLCKITNGNIQPIIGAQKIKELVDKLSEIAGVLLKFETNCIANIVGDGQTRLLATAKVSYNDHKKMVSQFRKYGCSDLLKYYFTITKNKKCFDIKVETNLLMDFAKEVDATYKDMLFINKVNSKDYDGAKKILVRNKDRAKLLGKLTENTQYHTVSNILLIKPSLIDLNKTGYTYQHSNPLYLTLKNHIEKPHSAHINFALFLLKSFGESIFNIQEDSYESCLQLLLTKKISPELEQAVKLVLEYTSKNMIEKYLPGKWLTRNFKRIDTKIISMLLNHGLRLDKFYGENEKTLFHSACDENMLGTIQVFISDVNNDINHKSKGGETGLRIAFEGASYDVAKLLIERGAKLELNSGPLMIHCWNDDAKKRSATFAKLISLLVNIKADFNVIKIGELGNPLHAINWLFKYAEDEYNNIFTPSVISGLNLTESKILLDSCKIGNASLAFHLIENEADVNISHSYERTALFYAIENLEFDLAKALIIKGARLAVEKPTHLGWNNITTKNYNDNHTDGLIQTLFTLIAKKQDLSSLEINDISPIAWAARHCKTLVKPMMLSGVEMDDSYSKAKFNPFYIARNNQDVILLIELIKLSKITFSEADKKYLTNGLTDEQSQEVISVMQSVVAPQ